MKNINVLQGEAIRKRLLDLFPDQETLERYYTDNGFLHFEVVNALERADITYSEFKEWLYGEKINPKKEEINIVLQFLRNHKAELINDWVKKCKETGIVPVSDDIDVEIKVIESLMHRFTEKIK